MAAYYGHKNYHSPLSGYVAAYADRTHLSRLGIATSAAELPAQYVDKLLIVHAKVLELNQREAKRTTPPAPSK